MKHFASSQHNGDFTVANWGFLEVDDLKHLGFLDEDFGEVVMRLT